MQIDRRFEETGDARGLVAIRGGVFASVKGGSDDP
jgi:hypothetical protein